MNGLIVQWPETAEERHTLVQALVASKSDPDVLTYDQAVRDIDVESWLEAMNKEIMSLVAQGTWELVPQSEATAAGQKIIPGTRVLCRKFKPNGSISKLKARWCVRGDLQELQDNTFAPVVRWETIRMLLYFSLFFGLKTKSIDFSNAFVQAILNDPIYVHLPRGFWHEGSNDICCKLKKSLYGITQAPRLWFEHLHDKLVARGFHQSRYDPCLFYSKEVYLVVYVDDVILVSRSEATIDHLIESLKVDSQLTDEGELSSFLGIQVTKDIPNKSYTLMQTGLTDRIIAALGLADANPNWVPAPNDAVGSDPYGPQMNETWEYRSVIGMLLYLSGSLHGFNVGGLTRFGALR
jgi:hypothetical protein